MVLLGEAHMKRRRAWSNILLVQTCNMPDELDTYDKRDESSCMHGIIIYVQGLKSLK